jgi:hypothetical protein
MWHSSAKSCLTEHSRRARSQVATLGGGHSVSVEARESNVGNLPDAWVAPVAYLRTFQLTARWPANNPSILSLVAN